MTRLASHLLLLSVLSVIACSPQSYPITKTRIPIVIDAQTDDWDKATVEAHPKAPLSYAFQRVDQQLYILLITSDSRWQQQLLMTGLACHMSAQGRKRNQRSIRYPIGLDPSNQPHDPNRLNEFLGRLQSNREALLATMTGLEMIGFSGKKDTTFTDNPNPAGIAAAARFTGDTLIWELAFPLRLLPGNREAKAISIEWETGKLSRPEQLRGDDAASLSGSNPSNTYKARGQSERDWLARLDRYRTFAAPLKAGVKVEVK